MYETCTHGEYYEFNAPLAPKETKMYAGTPNQYYELSELPLADRLTALLAQRARWFAGWIVWADTPENYTPKRALT